jgi:hypothetical protein
MRKSKIEHAALARVGFGEVLGKVVWIVEEVVVWLRVLGGIVVVWMDGAGFLMEG